LSAVIMDFLLVLGYPATFDRKSRKSNSDDECHQFHKINMLLVISLQFCLIYVQMIFYVVWFVDRFALYAVNIYVGILKMKNSTVVHNKRKWMPLMKVFV